LSSGRSSALSVFRNRNFTLLLTAMLVSDFGTAITSIAASILVFRETDSAWSVGLMLIATSLPGLLFGLVAGVFVDRMDRKRILVITELLSGVLILGIPLLLPGSIAWLYVLVALKSVLYQFFSPAHNSVIPDIVTNEELAAANSLLSSIQTAAMGLGYAAAGFIVTQFSPESAFYVNAATFFISSLLISLVVVPSQADVEDTTAGAVAQNLRDGTVFLWHSPALRSMLLLIIPIGIIYGFLNSTQLPFAFRALGATEFQYSLIESLSLVGFVAGALVMTVITDRLREGQWIAISFLMVGLLEAVYSQLTSVTAVILISMLFFFFDVPSHIGQGLLVQRNTTRQMRGRVSSVFYVVRDFSMMIGVGMVGIVDVIDIRLAILGASLALVVFGIIAFIMPGLRRPAAEWHHSLALLRGISEAPGLDTGRSITMADVERLRQIIPAFSCLTVAEQQRIVSDITYAEAEAGTVIVRQGEENVFAYFILEGSVVVGHVHKEQERILMILNVGDFFGEIAALTGVPRTANILAKERTSLLRVPSHTLRDLVKHPALHRLFFSKMMERMMSLDMLDMPTQARHDQNMLRELRTTTEMKVVVVD
jgi:MFS transporter, DHA3 family, macrolide efflux protein